MLQKFSVFLSVFFDDADEKENRDLKRIELKKYQKCFLISTRHLSVVFCFPIHFFCIGMIFLSTIFFKLQLFSLSSWKEKNGWRKKGPWFKINLLKKLKEKMIFPFFFYFILFLRLFRKVILTIVIHFWNNFWFHIQQYFSFFLFLWVLHR